jgi:CIC family chloride channel protein
LLAPLGAAGTVAVPALGGVVVGLVVAYVLGHERHHGVAGIIEAIALDGGRLRYGRAPLKAATAAVAIGTGASVGPEDPSVQIGANLGSFIGLRFGLPDERVRTLVAAGAAAGIAAAFNAPIAGVFFAIEVLLGDFAGSGLGIILLAAVTSSVFVEAFAGREPAFAVPAYALGSAWELPAYVALGALAGPVAAGYVRAIDAARTLFDRSGFARAVRPAIAGLAVGLAALALPQVRGVGYAFIEDLLRGAGPATGVLIALVAAKLVLTSACIGAGVPGGVFAPSLFVGAALGGAFGSVLGAAFPSLGIVPGAYAMVGMAAVLTGAVHAPLTAMLLLFEMTRDYRILLPAMLATAVSLFVARAIERESVYSMPLARRGIRHRALAPIEVEQFVVGERAPCAGRRIADVAWPRDCVVARVRRGGTVVSPRGDTVIEPGDVVVAVVGDGGNAELRRLFRSEP